MNELVCSVRFYHVQVKKSIWANKSLLCSWQLLALTF